MNGIRARAGSTQIVVLNLPNMAALPYLAGASLAQKQAAQRASVRMTTTAINTLQGVKVIDLMCDTASIRRRSTRPTASIRTMPATRCSGAKS